MSTTLPPTPAAQNIARQAMAQMQSAGAGGRARRAGDEALTQIASQGNAVEATIAKATQVAARRQELDNKVAEAPEAAALRLIADGVSVPAEQGIAWVGDKATSLAETYDATQSRDLGVDFLYQYLQVAATPQEKAVAQAAFDASRQNLTDRNAAIAQQVGLHALAGGVSGSPALAIAAIARDTTNQSDRWDDSRDMGYIFLQALADNADNDHQRQIASTALQASGGYMSASNATNIQLHAYQDILNSGQA